MPNPNYTRRADQGKGTADTVVRKKPEVVALDCFDCGERTLHDVIVMAYHDDPLAYGLSDHNTKITCKRCGKIEWQ